MGRCTRIQQASEHAGKPEPRRPPRQTRPLVAPGGLRGITGRLTSPLAMTDGSGVDIEPLIPFRRGRRPDAEPLVSPAVPS